MDVRVEVTIKTMHHSLADQVSLVILSRGVNLSPSRLRQLFKNETGRSPMQYLRHLRMQHAQELLRGSFLSIKEVAFLSGAKDLSHFVRAFKKEYGVTPSGFRLQNQS